MSKEKGFTLVEFLLYIAIVSVVLTVAGATILNTLFGKAKLAALQEVNGNARVALGNITNAVEESLGVFSPAPFAASSTLSLVVSDVAKSPTVFHVNDGVLYITEGTSSSSPLTSSEVRVEELFFQNVSSTSTPTVVTIRLRLRTLNPGGRPENDFRQTFYATSNSRKN